MGSILEAEWIDTIAHVNPANTAVSPVACALVYPSIPPPSALFVEPIKSRAAF